MHRTTCLYDVWYAGDGMSGEQRRCPRCNGTDIGECDQHWEPGQWWYCNDCDGWSWRLGDEIEGLDGEWRTA